MLTLELKKCGRELFTKLICWRAFPNACPRN